MQHPVNRAHTSLNMLAELGAVFVFSDVCFIERASTAGDEILVDTTDNEAIEKAFFL